MNNTLTALLQAEAVPFETIHRRYGSLLQLVRKLIGVVPNCDPYMEIWPPSFRTYNVLVPNFLNLPFLLWGMSAPRPMVGLGMYVSSRVAGCSYCSAHSCSFALRRGAGAETITRSLDEHHAARTPAEQAVITVARSLASIPATLTAAERRALEASFSPADTEWIVLAIAMMGFLNKFMDGLGVELEGSTMDEVRGLLAPTGWTAGKHLRSDTPRSDTPPPTADSLGSRLGVVRLIPSALALDRKWTAGVPDRWPAVGALLRERTGHDFPLLSRLRHRRAIRTIAMMLRDNLDPATSVLGVPAKCLAGAVYASVIGDPELLADVRAVAAHHGVSGEAIDAVQALAGDRDAHTMSSVAEIVRRLPSGLPPSATDARAQAALLVTAAISPSPAQETSMTIEECRAAGLGAAAVVELVTWISVLQMLHRLNEWFRAS